MRTVTWAVPVVDGGGVADGQAALGQERGVDVHLARRVVPVAGDQRRTRSRTASPANAWALTFPATPGTLTWSRTRASSCARARLGAAARRSPPRPAPRSGSLARSRRPGRTAGPAPGPWPSGSGACAARLSEEFSPNAKITAVAPNAIAASVTAVRAGRANGAARPEADRARQAQPRGQPVRGVPAARPRGAAGGDRLRGRQPSGAQRGPERGQRGQQRASRPGRRPSAHQRHLLAADPVGAGRLVQHRDGQQVARHHPGQRTRPAPASRPGSGRPTTTWAGVRPRLFSTPIRWYPATTAPLTTLPTMSTAMARPISANATTNGSMIAPLPVAWFCAVSQERGRR